MKPEELENRLIQFASRVMDMAESMPHSFLGKHLGNQVVRSATSPALNYGEARAAESAKDFIHKMRICQKELRETSVCLRLIASRNWFSPQKLSFLQQENDELISIFVASNKTLTKHNHARKSKTPS